MSNNRRWLKYPAKKTRQSNPTVKAPPASTSPALHGYHGFRLYFINDDALDVPKVLQNAAAFEKYISQNAKQFGLQAIKKNKVFMVNLSELKSDSQFLLDWNEFPKDIISDTEQCLLCMGLAMHQTIVKEDMREGEQIHVSLINARITNHQPILHLKSLKVNSFGTLVSVRGTVIKASSVRLMVKHMTFMCSSCDGKQVLGQPDGVYSPPVKCPTKGCRAQSNFIPLLSSETVTANWQTLKLQELVGVDQDENGRVPRTIECELTEDLVGCCIPGDDITITGIMKVRNINEVRQKKGQPSIFLLYIDAVSIVNNKNQSQAVGGTLEWITFNTNDYYAIQKIHSEPALFRFLVQSLCPNIYGNEIVKSGLLLALFGGTQVSDGDITTRAISHVLIVGDPGLGKSHMLQACSSVAPRGVYVCGNASTGAGLTVTMNKESHGEYSLEAGALVLADRGCCCVDEFDKMTTQHAYLLEAMEQQSISIAKAGVTCSLPACTTILAAANPSGGHYNKAKTVSENIKISPPLISRFDLVFILLDQPCEQYDSLLSEHVLALHSGSRSKLGCLLNNTSATTSSKSLKSRLQLQPGEVIDHLPHQLLRKYIAYAQKYVQPRLSQEAQDVLRKFYLELRKQGQVSGSSPVTARQLESLLRLTQARAKAELREEATAEDAADVVEIMRHSLVDVFTDEFGVLDLSRSQNGAGLSKQGQVKRLMLELQHHAERLQRSVFSQDEIQQLAEQVGIPKENFSDTLQKLNFHGYLLKRSFQKYQLTSVDFV